MKNPINRKELVPPPRKVTLTKRALALLVSLALVFTLLPLSGLAAVDLTSTINNLNTISSFLERLKDTTPYKEPLLYKYPDIIDTAKKTSDAEILNYGSPDDGGFYVDGKLDWNKVMLHLFRNNDATPNWDANFYRDATARMSNGTPYGWTSNPKVTAPSKSYHGETRNGNLLGLLTVANVGLGTTNGWSGNNVIGGGVKEALKNLDVVPQPIMAAIIEYLGSNDTGKELTSGYTAPKYGWNQESWNAKYTITYISEVLALFKTTVLSTKYSYDTYKPVIVFGTGDGEIDMNKIAALFDSDPFAIHLDDPAALDAAVGEISKLFDAIDKNGKTSALNSVIGGPAFVRLIIDLAAAGAPDEYSAQLTPVLESLKSQIKGGLSAEQWLGLIENLKDLLTSGEVAEPVIQPLSAAAGTTTDNIKKLKALLTSGEAHEIPAIEPLGITLFSA
ncbi:MAG: hypothetical protein LBD92_07490, partial [Oscillospiraceae bacterium]|nr:hypothetical protein [Oscillospiraceae bacterium]